MTNETEKNYSITVHGSYLDANGNVLKTETQEWEQFAAGWQKYFLFRPHMQFDRFEYTVETTDIKKIVGNADILSHLHRLPRKIG